MSHPFRRTHRVGILSVLALLGLAPIGCHSASPEAPYDILIRHGHILDGTGNASYAGDVAIRGDRIAAIGSLDGAKAKRVIDASGLVVSPRFIDMLGQSEESLLIDNRSLSKLSQGITSEITGEGGSIAPQNELTLAPQKNFLEQYHLSVDWRDLAGYFRRLEKSGTPINLGTYVGATQVREAVLGDVDRAPTPAELKQMESLVAEAMQQGAMGISTALIYPPGHYATTEELICPGQGRVAVRRHLCLAHAQRRAERNGGDRRSHAYRPRSAPPGRDFPPQGQRQGALGWDAAGDREASGCAGFRSGHRRQHVSLRRRRNTAGIFAASLDGRRGHEQTTRAFARSRDSPAHRGGYGKGP
jgi:hypothetical protein